MKNFNVKKSGSEVILEEVKPLKMYIGNLNPEWNKFEETRPLILTSIDPNIKVDQVIREDQLEPDLWQCYFRNGEYPNGAWINCLDENDAIGSKKLGATVRQVAKLKQVQLSDKIGHLHCDPEALKDHEFVKAINQMAELAYLKGKQPVHETPKSGHDLETCTEKEEKERGEETEIDELKTKVINLNTHSRQVFANWIINNSKSF